MSQDPIQQLSEEHRPILAVVDYLAALAPQVVAGDAVDIGRLQGVLAFMQEFADRCHHAKEEELLFPMLVEVNVPESGCPIGGLKAEHAKGRKLVDQLQQAITLWDDQQADARQLLAGAIDGIVTLYPSHIWKEDDMVFPMASRILDPARLDRLRAGFAAVDAQYRHCHPQHIAFAESLRQHMPAG